MPPLRRFRPTSLVRGAITETFKSQTPRNYSQTNLFSDHFSVLGFVDGVNAVFLQLLAEVVAGLDELPLLGVVLLLDLGQLGFQLLLVHRQRLDLSLQNLPRTKSF